MSARILVVEDDPPSRALVRLLLAGAGYAVLEAANGATGLELAREAHPALVLSDLKMPVADGFAMLRALRADAATHGLAVVALTAYNMPGDRETVLAAGFNGYLPKPINPELFARQVGAFLPPGLRAPAAAHLPR